jgi:S-sulfo-L-cysteine synthase (3-phospho-L-serine-dependent)
MIRRLLLVESNTTGTGPLFASCAAALGVEPLLVTNDVSRYPFVAKDGVAYTVADTSDLAAIIAVARSLARDCEIAGVTSSSEYYIEAAAACAEALGLPGPNPAAVRACRDKCVQLGILHSAGVGVPAFVRVRNAAEVYDAEISFPAIVKPGHGSGSIGVRLCADVAQAATHAAKLLRTTVNERGLLVPAEVLIEDYVIGPEFSVEVFGGRAVAIVAKHLGPLPRCVETGHDIPPDLDSGQERLLADTAIDAVRALGVGWGAVHVELRLSRAGPRIIEVNPRLAGGMIPELLRRTRGVELLRAQLMVAVGLSPRVLPRGGASGSIRFVTAAADGTVMAPGEAVAAALAVPGVVDAAIYRTAGERVSPAEDFRGRIGHVIGISECRHDAAADIAERGLKLLAAAVRYGPQGGKP